MSSQMSDEDTSTGPFIGFVLGTVLFGLTILQAAQYYFLFPGDSLFCKLKVGTVCALDLLHFVFSVSLFHANFVSVSFRVFGSESSITNDCEDYMVQSLRVLIILRRRLKALSMTQTLLIVLVQTIYLSRIHTLSNIPALNNKVFRRVMNVVICLIGVCAISVGIVFCYRVQNVKVALVAATNMDLSWVIYLGFGAAAGLDAIITVLTCFILHKNRCEIGLGYISRKSNRLLLSLFTYSLATGILTTLAATLVIVLYLERPTTADYLSVTFITTRLYTNSLLSFVQNVRRQLSNQDTSQTFGLGTPAEIVFRTQQHFPDVEASIPLATCSKSRTPLGLISDSDAESDSKPQHLNAHSPYYGPLQAKRQQVQEVEEMRNTAHFDLFSSSNARHNGPIYRRSSL